MSCSKANIKGNVELYNKNNTNSVFDEKNKDKHRNNLKLKIKIKYKYKQIIFHLLIIINLINLINLKLSSNLWNLIEYGFSNITLKINGIGEKSIFCFNSTLFNKKYYPNEVYINGEKQNTIKYSYIFNQTENFVELV